MIAATADTQIMYTVLRRLLSFPDPFFPRNTSINLFPNAIRANIPANTAKLLILTI